MNESKWRGISQYTSEMVYGQLLRGENNFNIVTDFKMKAVDIELVPIKKGTQGQYIGLKDINGNEVFEKDIVEDYEGKRFIVEYNLFYAYMLYPVEDRTSYMAMYPTIKLKVIGNIHENPELLEV